MAEVKHAVRRKSSMRAFVSGKLDDMAKREATDFRGRLAFALKRAGNPSGEKLAGAIRKLGGDATKQSLFGLTSGSSKLPRADNAIYLARALKVRVEWLLLGELPMVCDADLSAEEHETISLTRQLAHGTRMELINRLRQYVARMHEAAAGVMPLEEDDPGSHYRRREIPHEKERTRKTTKITSPKRYAAPPRSSHLHWAI